MSNLRENTRKIAIRCLTAAQVTVVTVNITAPILSQVTEVTVVTVGLSVYNAILEPGKSG